MPKARRSWITLIFACVLVLLGVCAVAEHFVTQSLARRDTELLRQMLVELGPAYAKVSAHTTSHPRPILVGTVLRQADRDRLVMEVTRRFGASRTPFIIGLVMVNSPPTLNA